MSTRTLTYGMSNWYVTFKNIPNVVALIPRKIEQTASNMALAYADRFGGTDITLRKIHARKRT